MTRGYDEPFTLYGLLARKVETDPQRSFVGLMRPHWVVQV
jgi:peptide/nickel transport system substrate-binding protein